MVGPVNPEPLDIHTLASRVCSLESGAAHTNRELSRLRALFVAKRTPHVMERGMTFFAAGDAVPSKSTTDLQEGDIYAFGDVPLRFTKNTTGHQLHRGDRIMNGVVDSELRHDFVAPNDFFWLEL